LGHPEREGALPFGVSVGLIRAKLWAWDSAANRA
jgi:hypothetical protein